MNQEPSKVHEDETDINIDIVRKLLQGQFPQWQDLPLKLIHPEGTDNVMYQLGDDKAIRLPRTSNSAINIEKECRWLPKLAPNLPIAVPTPLAVGKSTEMYPHPWAICQLLAGLNPSQTNPIDELVAAVDLGHFVAAMQQIDSQKGPNCRRGLPLVSRDEETREAIQALSDLYDSKGLLDIWLSMLSIPRWKGKPIWIHGDLHAGNLLAQNKKITAIVDFGSSGVGDPASDLMVSWTLLTTDTRKVFRSIVEPDDATWDRGRAWAFTFGIVAYPYYRKSNPIFAEMAKRAIDEVLSDYECI